MANLGAGELVLITVVLLLVFGTSRLPAIGDALGRALRRDKGTGGPPSTGTPAS